MPVTPYSSTHFSAVQAQAPNEQAAESAQKTGKTGALWGDDGFDFWDIVDAINPLQHIPVVSTVYRQITGDEIDSGSRMAGGALFGGPIGFMVSAAISFVEGVTGKDPEEHIVAMFTGDEKDIPTNSFETASAAPIKPVYMENLMPEAYKPSTLSNKQTEPAISPMASVPASVGTARYAANPGSIEGLNAIFTGVKKYTSNPFVVAAKAEPMAPPNRANPIYEQPSPKTVKDPAKEAKVNTPPMAATDREIATRMLQALDKYETLMRSRYAENVDFIEKSY